jgi:hypothetical protein
MTKFQFTCTDAIGYAFECKIEVFGEQRNEPYKRYGEVSSGTKTIDLAPKALSGKRLGRLAGKGGA